MDSDNYKKYVEDILYKKKDSLFSGETVVRKAIVSYDIKGTFLLLQLTSDYCYLYECETDDVSSKFRIKSYDIYHHKLSKIFCEKFDEKKFDKFSWAYFKQDGRFVYDEYYSQLSVELAEHNKALQQALCELPSSWKCSSLYIDGDYSEIPSVVYALQRNATEIISMKLDKPLSTDNNKVLKCRFPDVVKGKIRTDNNITFLDCLKVPQTVFVPLNDNSLDSFFYNEIKWRDILPNFEKDCEIAGIECKTIMLKTKVDGFQNVFCRASDAKGNNKYLLVYNSQNVDLNLRNEPIDNHPLKQKKVKDINDSKALPKDKLSTQEIEGREINELVKEIHIKAGDTGYSYKSLFGDFLKGASVVVLSEPYLVKHHQWVNLKEFISLIMETANIKSLSLKTRDPEVADIGKNRAREEFVRDFYNKLESIKDELKGCNIIFTWELSKTHKRWLDIDEYHIDLDYGLDIYTKPADNTVLSSVLRLKKCKENHIKVYKKIGTKL
mgnify:CR=1 FL=1